MVLTLAACNKDAPSHAEAKQEPEPQVYPCRHCTVDVTGRVSGEWAAASCLPGGPAEVAYPVTGPSVEVLSGAQKGREFMLAGVPESFASGAALSGTLPAEADVKNWSEAKLWVKGANGSRCASLLSIQR